MARPESHSLQPITRRRFVGISGVAAATLILGACGGAGSSVSNQPKGTGDEIAVDYASMFASHQPADEPDGDPAKVVWPEFVLAAPPEVQELYAFHVTSGSVMRYIPCFCGCGGSSDHRNNRDCYVREVHADGSITFDSMAPT